MNTNNIKSLNVIASQCSHTVYRLAFSSGIGAVYAHDAGGPAEASRSTFRPLGLVVSRERWHGNDPHLVRLLRGMRSLDRYASGWNLRTCPALECRARSPQATLHSTNERLVRYIAGPATSTYLYGYMMCLRTLWSVKSKNKSERMNLRDCHARS